MGAPPRELLELLAERIEPYHGLESAVYLVLSRGELRRLGPEALRWLERYARRYRRGHHALRPGSLRDFVARGRYRDSDEVEIEVPLRDLVDAGLLRVVEVGGWAHWALGDRVLEPRRYPRLYGERGDTLRTLARDAGYLEVVERGGRVRAQSYSDCPLALEVEGGSVDLCVGGPRARLSYDALPGGELRRRRGPERGEGALGTVDVWVRVGREEGLEGLWRAVGVAELLAQEQLSNMLRYAEEELGLDPRSLWVLGTVEIEGRRLSRMRLTLGREAGEGGVEARLSLDVTKLPHDHRISVELRLSRRVSSRYVGEALLALFGGEAPEAPPGYALRFDRLGASLTVELEAAGAPLPPSAARHRAAVERLERLLREMIVERLESAAGEPLRYPGGPELPLRVGDVLRLLRWGRRWGLDALRLRLALLRLLGLDEARPPLPQILTALAILEGHPRERVTDAVNRPLDVLIELVRRGKLRPAPGGERPGALFEGRDLWREELDAEHLFPQPFAEAVLAALSLALPREELEKVRRARAAR